MAPEPQSKKLALLAGGGPAPGINGVISSVTIEAEEQGIEVIGFVDGFKWLVQGNPDHVKHLTIDNVKQIHDRGGSILRTARTNPAEKEEYMRNVLNVFAKHNVTMLVTVGGDDTAFSGSQVYKWANGRIRVAHVPKTIDNDLPLPGSMPTFGFETARQVGVNIVGNLAEDARTTARWYLIVSMGRACGHLALGIGKAAAATLTLIPEEFDNRPIMLDEVCDLIIGAIIKRRTKRAPHGVVVLAEGLLEKIGEEGLGVMMEDGNLSHYGKIVRDPHGHLRLGEIDFGRMIKDRLATKLEELNLSVSMVNKDLGYELRCADPIPFDVEYTRDLGYGAVKFLRSEEAGKYGAIISLDEGQLKPLPFQDMINPETGRMRPRKVDIKGERYECARRYMIRLTPQDFEDSQRLHRLAEIVHMEDDAFRRRFEYLVTTPERPPDTHAR
jgi:6-phosphofructokinase